MEPIFATMRKILKYAINGRKAALACFELYGHHRNNANRKTERSNMTDKIETPNHPLRAAFRDAVDAALASQIEKRGQPAAGPKGEVFKGWSWNQNDSIEVIAQLACELSSLAKADGIADEDLLVFKDLINHPINPSAFRQRLEARQRIPKGEGRASRREENADLF